MVTLSLLLNIIVLIPVSLGLATNAAWARESYGENSPARGILLSMYLAILLVSITLLFFDRPQPVAALLIVQVVYKVTTPFTVRTVKNPIVISNILIAAFHAATLIFMSNSVS
jgi:hypothetical protein